MSKKTLNPLYKKQYMRYYELISTYLIAPETNEFPRAILDEYTPDWKDDLLLQHLSYLSTYEAIIATKLNLQVTRSQLQTYKDLYEIHYEKFFHQECSVL